MVVFLYNLLKNGDLSQELDSPKIFSPGSTLYSVIPPQDSTLNSVVSISLGGIANIGQKKRFVKIKNCTFSFFLTAEPAEATENTIRSSRIEISKASITLGICLSSISKPSRGFRRGHSVCGEVDPL